MRDGRGRHSDPSRGALWGGRRAVWPRRTPSCASPRLSKGSPSIVRGFIL